MSRSTSPSHGKIGYNKEYSHLEKIRFIENRRITTKKSKFEEETNNEENSKVSFPRQTFPANKFFQFVTCL